MHSISGLNLALQWHLCGLHVHSKEPWGYCVFLWVVVKCPCIHEGVAS